MSATTHTTDTDCTLDATDVCTVCGVGHFDQCASCQGRGFHVAGCAESDALLCESCGREVSEAEALATAMPPRCPECADNEMAADSLGATV